MASTLCNLVISSTFHPPNPSHTRAPGSITFPYKSTLISSPKLIFNPNRVSCCAKLGTAEYRVKPKEVSQATLIWRAVKLPIYSVALIPLSVGASAAYLHTGFFSAQRFFSILGSSVLIIAWLNLSNDVYDFDTGADKDKKESVVNLLGSRSGTFIAAIMALLLGCGGLLSTSFAAKSTRAILLLACAILCGYVYQCPPFRLSYSGLGEPLCFAAFGPFATTAFYFLLGSHFVGTNPPVTSVVLVSSLLVGFTTSLILFCSHFHQIEGDVAVGKLSPLVRIGTEKAAAMVKYALIFFYGFLVVCGVTKLLPIACVLLCGLTFPMASLVTNFVKDNHLNKDKIFMAKYYCVRLHALFGTALALGLAISRHIPSICL